MPKSAEFILQPNLSSVVLVEPFGPAFAAVAEKLGLDATLQTVECISAMDALSIVRQMSSCVILAHAANTTDVNQHLTLLKTLSTQIQTRKSVRMLVTVSSSLSAELVEKLTIYGCTEIIPDMTPAKALLFKLDRHLKALPRPGVLDPENKARGAGAAIRPDLPGEAEVPNPDPLAGVRLAPPLDLPNDCWCLSGGGARQSQGKWRVKVRGLAPDHGRWLSSDKKDIWVWRTVGEESNVQAGGPQTGWYFESEQRPEYSRGYWTFTSDSPWLGYLENGNPVGYKFKINEKGSLVVARDSDAALSALAVARGKLAKKEAAHEMQVAIAPVEPPPASPVSSEAKVVFVEPLKLLSDFWVIEKGVPRRVADRWLIQIVGPGPAVGRWMPQAERTEKVSQWSGSSEKWWRWVPDAGERDPFIKEQGSWFFFGLSPNFSDGLWSFASISPELGFYYKGKCYGAKFKLIDDHVLEVARDSAAALGMLALIKVSFERQVASKTKMTPRLPPATAAIGVEVEPGDPRGDPTPARAQPSTAASESLSLRPEVVASPADAIQSAPLVPAGLEKIFAAEVPGPTLSVLALVFLASELAARRGGGDLRARCDRYCAYLMASFGGLRVELWVQSVEGEWVCVGTPDHSAGIYRDCAKAGAGLRALKSVPMRIVEVRPSLQNPIGILVVGGRGAQKIDASYAEGAARAAVSLVFGAKAELAA